MNIKFIVNYLGCYYCAKSIIGDPKYHEVYVDSVKVGHRHRDCPRSMQ